MPPGDSAARCESEISANSEAGQTHSGSIRNQRLSYFPGGLGFPLALLDYHIIWMVRVPLCHQVISGLADVGAVQYPGCKLGIIVEFSPHHGVGAEENIEFAVHANGGSENPQAFDLDRLTSAMRLQHEIP